jgi:tetratricopeptide (TPR) repeat protein
MRKNFLVLINSLLFAGLLYSQQPSDYLMQAIAYTESGKTHQAVVLLSEGLLQSRDYRLFIGRAEAYMAEGNYTNAAADYQSANSLALSSGEYGLARIYALKGDAANSLKHLELNIGSEYRKSEKQIMLDAAFSLIENTPDWRLFWKKERYTIYEKKISEIEYCISAGKPEDAGSALKELESYNSEDQNTLYAKGIVSLSQGKYSESITLLLNLLESDKKNEKYLRLLAKAQMSAGNAAGASQSITELINNGVPDASLFLQRAECYNKTGETVKALKDIDSYLKLYPENKKALSFAGRIEAQSGDNLKALDYFSKNLKLHPGDAGCYVDRGNSYFVSKTWDFAIKDYSMALDILPSDPEVWLNKGIALLSTGKVEDACHDFRTALSLGNKKATPYISRNCIK